MTLYKDCLSINLRFLKSSKFIIIDWHSRCEGGNELFHIENIHILSCSKGYMFPMSLLLQGEKLKVDLF